MRGWQQVAPGVLRMSAAPRDSVNVYMLGDVLVDAGLRIHVRRLLQALQLPGVPRPTAHALTHAHEDHQGGSDAVCRHFDIPLWCAAGDRAAMETGDLRPILPRPDSVSARIVNALAGPPHPVARILREGDDVGAGFVALETPGHTPGSICFWRASDRILVLGDVAMSRHPFTLRPGLREPLAFGTVDRAANMVALRRLAALGPAVVCFGHGAPVTEPAVFHRFVEGLNLVRR